MTRPLKIANHNYKSSANGNGPVSVDQVQPFMLDISRLRGRMVRLDGAVDKILTLHDYPPLVARLLGEALTLTTLLAGMLKYDGVFTLQIKGSGPVTLLVCDLTTKGHLRGYAGFDPEALAALSEADKPDLKTLCGEGYLAFTVDQKNVVDRYQGIVPLDGDTLCDAVRYYFQQSEQLKTGFDAAVGHKNGSWHACGIMLQHMPGEGGHDRDEQADMESDTDVDAWRRAMMLLGTVSHAEMLDDGLTMHDLLFRLFHEEGVRVFAPLPIQAKCRCSRAKIAPIIESLPLAEKRELAENGRITVTCEFCNRNYHFPVEPDAEQPR